MSQTNMENGLASLNMADQLSQTLKTTALFMGACVSVAVILKLATALINKIH